MKFREKQKESQMKRLVTSANVDLRPNQKLNLNLNYSNFQSFTNSRNQFDYINQVSNYDYLDTLNFRQVSQNLTLAVNYLLKNDKTLKKSINANFSMQDAVNQQQGRTIEGGATTYYNSGLSYSIGYPMKDLNLIASINNTYGKTDSGKNCKRRNHRHHCRSTLCEPANGRNTPQEPVAEIWR